MRTRDLLPLRDAARLFPRFREGRPPAAETLRRWCRTGQIDATKIGPCFFLTREAIDKFVAGRTRTPETVAHKGGGV